MLAPIDMPTGDDRRFAPGSITAAPTPFAWEWVREREGGHDGAVSVGAVTEINFGTVDQAVAAGWISAEAVKGFKLASPDHQAIWATGHLFDDADREETPQLAEDVAHALRLISEGVLGPSVDLDSFEGKPVKTGTDEEVTWDMLEEAAMTGEELDVELLITEGRVRAATLVSIPAFVETTRPLELITPELDAVTAAEATAETMALIASVGAATVVRPAATAFDKPNLSGPTPITYDFDKGVVYGHIATWQTCHTGITDVCTTAPRDPAGGEYPWFNRIPVETDGGIVWAGRLTAGGRHAPLSLSASGSMAHHDTLTTAAHVRAYEDEYGIVVAGPIKPGLSADTRSTLERRKVSADWRETHQGLSMVELLALSPGPRAHSEPGFPVVGTYSRSGRQTALTAALGPAPDGALASLISSPVVQAMIRAQAEAAAMAAVEMAARGPVVVTVQPDASILVEEDITAELRAVVEADKAAARAELAALIGEGV
jgi:hypothetical protein